jgi:hypothetical protein
MADPWLKFYPTDWRSDPALRMCQLSARGLWIEMIALMHEAIPYGHLLVSGRSPTDAQLAVLVGTTPEQIPALVGELESAGVFSRTREGVIYSRKMTRIAKKAAVARKNGKNGGNPTLCNNGENKPSDNHEVNHRDKPQKPEARSQTDKDKDAYASSSDEAAAVADYNDAASRTGWSVVQRMSKSRFSALRARMKDAGGLDGWRAAIRKAEASDFLCGRKPGRDGAFFASFDFLTQSTSFTRLMEGNYDNRTEHRPQPPQGRQNGPDAAIEQIARLTGLGAASGYDRH